MRLKIQSLRNRLPTFSNKTEMCCKVFGVIGFYLYVFISILSPMPLLDVDVSDVLFLVESERELKPFIIPLAFWIKSNILSRSGVSGSVSRMMLRAFGNE